MAELALWEAKWKARHAEGILEMRSSGSVTGMHKALLRSDVLAESFLYLAIAE